MATVKSFATVGNIYSHGIAIDHKEKNLFVVNTFYGYVIKISVDTGAVNNSFIIGLDIPEFITIDDNGVLYVAQVGRNRNDTILKYDALGNRIIDGFDKKLPFIASGLKFDRNGTLHVVDPVQGGVRKISSTGVVDDAPYITGILSKSFANIAFDLDGNMYGTNSNMRAIMKMDKFGNVTTLASGILQPIDLVVDCIGNVFVSQYYENVVSKITPNGNVSIYANTGFSIAIGLVMDKNGNLYVANLNSTIVHKILPPNGDAHGPNWGDIGCPLGPPPTTTVTVATTTYSPTPMSNAPTTTSLPNTFAPTPTTPATPFPSSTTTKQSVSSTTATSTLVTPITTLNSEPSSNTIQESAPLTTIATLTTTKQSYVVSPTPEISSMQLVDGTATQFVMTTSIVELVAKPSFSLELVIALIVGTFVITIILVIVIRGCIVWWRKHKNRFLAKPENNENLSQERDSQSGLSMRVRQNATE